MSLVRPTWVSHVVSLLAFVTVAALLAGRPVTAQSVDLSGPVPVVEGHVVGLPADNLLVTDIEVGRLRAAHIAEGEVLNVEVGASSLRARFVSRDEVQRLSTDHAPWAAADVDVLCFETGDRTLAITAAGAALADLVPTPALRRVVVSKP